MAVVPLLMGTAWLAYCPSWALQVHDGIVRGLMQDGVQPLSAVLQGAQAAAWHKLQGVARLVRSSKRQGRQHSRNTRSSRHSNSGCTLLSTSSLNRFRPLLQTS